MRLIYMALAVSVMLISGCLFDSSSSSKEDGTGSSDSGSYTVTIQFPDTSWSLVVEAGRVDTIVAHFDSTFSRFDEWNKVSGEGSVSFSDATSGTSEITVSGGDVVITGNLTVVDSLVVRFILDANGLDTLPYDSLLIDRKNGRIESLDIGYPEIVSLTGIEYLDSLKSLYIVNGGLAVLPAEIGKLTHLRTLSIGNNNLTELPDTLFSMPSLELLYAGNNMITELPVLPQSSVLTTLDISYNMLTTIDDSYLKATLALNIYKNSICTVSAELDSLLVFHQNDSWLSNQKCD